jgi:HSP20 family protein
LILRFAHVARVNPKIRETRLRQLEGQLGEVAYQITKVHFSTLRRPVVTWQPAVNVFECESCIRICVELAGVDPESVELDVFPGQLVIRGTRKSHEPATTEAVQTGAIRVMILEIDYGPFEREIPLPRDIYPERIKSQWEEGMLWLSIPRRPLA